MSQGTDNRFAGTTARAAVNRLPSHRVASNLRCATKDNIDRATLTLPELAKVLGISRSAAYALAQRDALPVPLIRLGTRMVVSRALVERLLAGQDVRVATFAKAADESSTSRRPGSDEMA